MGPGARGQTQRTTKTTADVMSFLYKFYKDTYLGLCVGFVQKRGVCSPTAGAQL